MRRALRAAVAASSLLAAPAVAFATHWRVLSSSGVAAPRVATAGVDACGAPGIRCGAAHASAACVEGRCLLVCDEGFADCDQDPGDGCEVELATDRRHCGRCDHGCGGAACEAGRCVARLLGRGAPITADDGAVYAYRGGVVKLPFDGTDETFLTTDAARDPPSSMAIDASLVYWAAPRRRAVLGVPRVGGEVSTVVAGVDAAAIAVADGALFGLEPAPSGGGVVKRMPVAGGVVVEAAHLARGAPPLLTSRLSDLALVRGAADALAGDAASLYWAAPGPGGEGSVVLRVGSKGGEPAPLVSHPFRIRALAVNATHVFWSDARENVFMAPKRRTE
jgi:hypothetical protein